MEVSSRWMICLLVLWRDSGNSFATFMDFKQKLFGLLTVSLLVGWGFLYILHKLPFDQSRHTLMFAPVLPITVLEYAPLVLRVPAFVMIAAPLQ